MATRWVQIPLEGREDGLWFGRLDGEEFPTGAQLWLGVQTALPHAEREVPSLAKVASWSDIADLATRHDPGVAIEATQIPAGGPPNAPATWFRLRQEGPRWAAMMSEETFAVLLPVPYTPDAAELVLYADAETLVGPTTRPPKDWGPPLA